MNPTVMTARVSDQHLLLVNEPLIASGGVNVIQIHFEFCGLWTGCGKTAVFYRDPETVYHLPIVEDSVTVPHEVLIDEGYFYFGVMGAADNVRTTEVIKVKVVKGAICTATAEPEEPTPDIYQQLVMAYAKAEEDFKKTRVRVQERNHGNYVTFWVGTLAEYQTIETREPNCLYIITDDQTPQELMAKVEEMGRLCELSSATAATAATAAASSAKDAETAKTTAEAAVQNAKFRRVYDREFTLDEKVKYVHTRTLIPKFFIVTVRMPEILYTFTFDWYAEGRYKATFGDATVYIDYYVDNNGTDTDGAGIPGATFDIYGVGVEVYLRRVAGFA